jgi:hypothetical protein
MRPFLSFSPCFSYLCHVPPCFFAPPPPPQAGGLSVADSERLRAQIALHVRTPTAAAAQPSLVLTLDLSRLDLSLISVAPFAHLERLSLRGNRLAALAGLGIDACVRLVALDVRDNALTSAADVMAVAGALPSLRALACAGNRKLGGGGNADEQRRALLAAGAHLRRPDCALRYLDERPIGVGEICEAHSEALGSQREAIEALRFALTLRRRTEDGGVHTQHLLALEQADLSAANLELLTGVAAMARMRKLNLDGNRLNSGALQKSDFGAVRLRLFVPTLAFSCTL